MDNNNNRNSDMSLVNVISFIMLCIGFIVNFNLCLAMMLAFITVGLLCFMVFPNSVDLSEDLNLLNDLEKHSQRLASIIITLLIFFIYFAYMPVPPLVLPCAMPLSTDLPVRFLPACSFVVNVLPYH